MNTYFTIPFDPDAAPPTPVEPAPPSLTITFAVVLNGAGALHTGAPGLSAQLTIPFSLASRWAQLCERAAFTEISPIGHAPLVLPSASYRGSTCHVDPADAQPWIVYLDDPESQQVLKIGPPTKNLWSWFQWPSATVIFDPDLTEHEQRPPLWFGIASFTDVQIPMRLQFEIPPDLREPKPTTVLLRELVYDDAPTFTASAYRVTCSGTTEHPIPMKVTGPEIATALREAGYDEAGTYDLYWRIYRGAGDMVYRARCIESALGEVTDRIVGSGGGFGIEIDTDLLVARVLAEPKPFPFLFSAGSAQYNAGPDGTVRTLAEPIPAGAGTWVSGDDPPTVVTWESGWIYCGRHVIEASNSVRCACLVKVEVDGEKDVECLQVYLVDGALERRVLRPDQAWAPMKLLAAPAWTYTHPAGGLFVITPSATRYAFSQDGVVLLGAAPHQLQGDKLLPAAVWETTLTLGTDWTRVYENDVYSTFVTSGTADENQQGGVFAGRATVFLAAGYRDSARIIQEVRAVLSVANQTTEDRSETKVPANRIMSGPLGLYIRRVQEGDDLPMESLTAYSLEGESAENEDLDLVLLESGNVVRTQRAVAWHVSTTWTEGAASSATWGDMEPDIWNYVDPAAPGDLYGLTEEELNEAAANRVTITTGEATSYRSVLSVPRHCDAAFWARLWRRYADQIDPDCIVSVFDANAAFLSVTETLANLPTYADTPWPVYPVPRAETHYEETTARTKVLTALYHAITQDGTLTFFYWDARVAGTTVGAYLQTYSQHAVAVATPDTIYEVTEDIPLPGGTYTLRQTCARACLISAGTDTPLPSGDPVIPPTYDALLDAIQTARSAAGVPAAGGGAVVRDLQATGGLTYEAAQISLTVPGAIEQTWTLTVTDPDGAFILSGDTLGFALATGAVGNLFAPLNPDTNTPYFVLAAAGWGGVHPAGASLTFRTTLAPLTVDASLVISTAIHCQWMVDHTTFTELGIDDTTPVARARLAGYRGGAVVGEIRGGASGEFSPPLEVLITNWLADPTSAAVLLGPDWTRVGGYLIPWPGNGYLACVDFGVEPPA